MLKSHKNVFWEALLLTVVVFFFGLLIGIMFETNRTEKINEYYAKSEISLVDIQTMQELINMRDLDCDALVEANLKFADKIYQEAKLLSKYEEVGKITEGIKLAHKKYDLLRTMLWINSIETNKICGDHFSVVVYLYEYESEDLAKKAMQGVWSKVLSDLKESQGEKIILIPISYNTNIITLDTMLKDLEITEFPIVVINDKYFIKELTSMEDFEKYLN